MVDMEVWLSENQKHTNSKIYHHFYLMFSWDQQFQRGLELISRLILILYSNSYMETQDIMMRNSQGFLLRAYT